MDDWAPVSVRDLIMHIASGPSPTCEERPAQSGEWGLLKTTAITWEKGWNSGAHKVPPVDYWRNQSTEVRAGDVLVTKAGPRHRVGVVAHVDETPPRLMVSGKMVLLRPDRSRVIPKFLAESLATTPVQKFLDQRTTGMAESQVNFANSTLLDCPLRIPTLEIQRRIVEILDTLDEKVRHTEQMISKFEAAREGAVLAQLEEVANPSDSPIHPLGDLVAAPVCYGIVQPGRHVSDGVPMVAIRDLAGDFTRLHRVAEDLDKQYIRSRVREDDVLLSVKATIGRTAVVPKGFDGNISRDVARLRPGRGVTAEYLELYLRSRPGQDLLRHAVVGTTRAEVSIGVLARLDLPLPPIDAQRRLAGLDQLFGERIATETATLASTRQLREGVAGDLLSGTVRAAAA